MMSELETQQDPAAEGRAKPETAATASAPAQASALPQEELDRLTDDIVAALKTVYDPEIPVNIFDLGLIYTIDISDENAVRIVMTLTAPGCPVVREGLSLTG